MLLTLPEGASYGIDDHTGTGIVAIGIVAHPVDTNQVALVLDGSSTTMAS